MSSTIYSEGFYDATTVGSLNAARKVLGHLQKIKSFDSVADVGCGVGTWLLAAKEFGARNIRGFEGAHVPDQKLLIETGSISRVDLECAIGTDQRFDLCLCLEVAEHLAPNRAVGLIADLTKLSEVVAFSAAIPFQGGDGHLNEMWPEYWANLFSKHKYIPWLGLRESIWGDRDIPWWYRQNIIVYVHATIWGDILKDQKPADGNRLTAIHPESYLWNVRRRNRPLKTSYEFDVEQYYEAPTMDRSPVGYGPEFPAPRAGSEDV